MKNGLLIALAICLFSNTLNAEEYFQDCDDVSEDSSYRLLNEYFSSGNIEEHNLCQRLNDDEFLFTTNMSVAYCKSNKGAALTCDHELYTNFAVVKRFAGGKGKQFVLFHTARLSHGYYGEGYHAFFLVPKRINQRGYLLFMFPSAGASDSDDGSGKCGGESNADVTTSLQPPFEILNENQSNVIVRFNQENANCKTGEKSKQTLEYTWKNFGFQQTLNRLEKLPPKH
jgi:hypothetical protein